jgi:ABC-2 type transport system permease protein
MTRMAAQRPGIGDRLGLASLRRHSELITALARRELAIRYKRSVLGVAWSLAEPLAVVAVYIAVFGYVLGADAGIANYTLFTLTGLAPWLFISATLEQSASVMLEHAPLIRKTYFPREILVGAVVFSRLTTLAFTLGLALVVGLLQVATSDAVVAWSRVPWMLVGVVLLASLTFGLALVVAALNVMLRDVMFLVRFALRLGFYTCPIVYPVARVPEAARTAYDLNPLVGILHLFQSVSDPGLPTPSGVAIVSSCVGAALMLGVGLVLFRRLEPTVADLL